MGTPKNGQNRANSHSKTQLLSFNCMGIFWPGVFHLLLYQLVFPRVDGRVVSDPPLRGKFRVKT